MKVKLFIRLCLLSSTLLLISCGVDKLHADNSWTSTNETSNSMTQDSSDDFKETANFIRKEIKKMKHCKEQNQSDDSNRCNPKTITLSAASVNDYKEKDRFRTLILEHDHILSSSTGRHKHRILNRFDFNEFGEAVPVNVSVEYEESFINIHNALVSYGKHVTNKMLSEFNQEINELYSEDFAKFNAEHGSPILEYLAENNPEMRFITATASLYPPAHILCTENKTVVKIYSHHIGRSIHRILSDNEIDFINYSGGLDHKVLMDIIETQCGSFKKIYYQNALYWSEKLHNALSSHPSALLIQAGNNKALKNDIKFKHDCSDKFENRIRVGSFNAPTLNIPKSGYALSITDQRFNIHFGECIDVAINSGIYESYPFRSGPFPVMASNGYGEEAFKQFAPSFAAPVFLTRLANLLKEEFHAYFFDQEFIHTVVSQFKSPSKVWLFHPERYRSMSNMHNIGENAYEN